MKLENIDPSLGLLQEFSKLSQGTATAVQKMRKEAIFTSNSIESKYKILGAVLWSISARCEPCIRFYTLQCVNNKNISLSEFAEYISIASVMGGCVGEMWTLKAFKAFKDGADGTMNIQSSEDPSCCS